jgi:hypothetical protein
MELSINMTTNDTLTDAVRTVGQLLLHHPTTGEVAKDRTGRAVDTTSKSACKFCYVGAVDAVARKLDVAWAKLDRKCDDILAGPGNYFDADDWDEGSNKQRKAWATKLANFKG